MALITFCNQHIRIYWTVWLNHASIAISEKHLKASVAQTKRFSAALTSPIHIGLHHVVGIITKVTQFYPICFADSRASYATLCAFMWGFCIQPPILRACSCYFVLTLLKAKVICSFLKRIPSPICLFKQSPLSYICFGSWVDISNNYF